LKSGQAGDLLNNFSCHVITQYFHNYNGLQARCQKLAEYAKQESLNR